MKKIVNILFLAAIIISSSFFLSACTKKTKTTNSNASKTTESSKQIELADNEKPIVSLIPRADGHNLTLKITGIPTKFTTADYELIYTAKDEDLEIEKGVSGTLKITGSSLEKNDLLLGTASCTNGCKYKYDEGVTGGTLTITLTTEDKQYVSYETPFTLKTGADINKDKKISLDQENFIVNGTATSKTDYFIAIKNFKSAYSIFSNGNGKGKITSIEPNTVTKQDLNSLVGDYLIP